MSQLPIQTTKIFYSFFDLHLCFPHLQNGSTTDYHTYLIRLVFLKRPIFQTQKYGMPTFASDGNINIAMLNFGNSKKLCLFCLMRQNKIHSYTRADQDWIGLMILKDLRIRTVSDSIFVDQDWTWTEKFHSPLVSETFETETGEKWVSRRVSRPRLSLETPSLLRTYYVFNILFESSRFWKMQLEILTKNGIWIIWQRRWCKMCARRFCGKLFEIKMNEMLLVEICLFQTLSLRKKRT